MARLEGAYRLSHTDKRLVQNVIRAHQSLKIFSDSSSDMTLQAIVVNQQQLRQRASIPGARLADQFGFRVISTHDEFLATGTFEETPLMLAAARRRRKWNLVIDAGFGE